MDSREIKEDYRKFIISKWVSSNIEGFRKLSLADLEEQSRYYQHLLNFIPKEKDIDILEVGCGYGGFIYTLKKFGYLKIDAIDIIPECIEFVSKKLQVNAICVDVFDFLSKNQKKYDIIAAFDVIEHFNKNEIVELLILIFEHLKENGTFIMRVPNAASPKGLYIRYSGFTHELAFTSLSIEELFKAVGFKKVITIPEPENHRNFIKSILNKFRKIFVAKLLSLDPNYVMSANIIGIGYK